MTTQQTLQQERAASAWRAVEKVESESKNERGKYGSLVRGLPALIQTDGLGQTLAFLLAKGRNDEHEAHQIAYNQISEWVIKQLGANKNARLLDFILRTDTATYRRATTEALAYLQWIKRFAEAKDWKSEGA